MSKKDNLKHLNCKYFTILYQNCRGLKTKTNEFLNSIESSNYDVILVTETWLTDSINDGELFDNRYSVIRKDRNNEIANKKGGGGVLLGVKTKYNVSVIEPTDNKFDCILVKLNLDYFIVYLCVIYFPPKSHVLLYNEFYDFLETNVPEGSSILLIGDFNLSEVTGSDFGFLDHTQTYRDLRNFAEIYQLNSINDVQNMHGKTLDLAFTNIPNVDLTHELNPLVPEDSYHPALLVEFKCNIRRTEKLDLTMSREKTYNFSKANFIQLYRELEKVNWENVTNGPTVDIFYKTIYQILDKCVPCTKRIKSNFPVWFSPNIIRLVKNKHYHRKKWKANIGNVNYHLTKFKEIRVLLKKEISTAYTNYVHNCENDILTNSQRFWDFVRTKRNNSDGNMLTHENEVLYDDSAIANKFKEYFQTHFNKSEYNLQRFPHHINSGILNNFFLDRVTFSDIELAIKKLKPRTSPGPDQVPSYVIKGCSEILKYPLHAIFNKSLSSCTFPAKWKHADICPVPKGGCSSHEIKNHRPIAVISAFAKIFESVIYKQIYLHMQPILSPYQHGFQPRKSTITNLAEFVHYLATRIDKRGQVDVIYTDFSKAFDVINHDILLNKLLAYNFSTKFCQFIATYLCERRHRIRYRGVKTNEYIITSGVPQGSHLGPLLFLIFVNDLPDIFHSRKLLFADDLKIFRTIETANDAIVLQDDINALNKWCEANKLLLNVNKCNVISFTRQLNCYKHDYTINDVTLNRVDTVTDLGVSIRSNLTFDAHINRIVNEASRNLGFIIRQGKAFTNIETFKTLYYAYVRSKLEYASIIWHSHTLCSMRKIEALQSRFVRFLTFKETGIYPQYEHYVDLVDKYSLHTLEKRRTYSCIIFLHRLMHGEIDSSHLLSEILFHVPSGTTRSQKATFHLTAQRTNVLDASPIRRMCSAYNNISKTNPKLDICCTSFTEFCNCVKEVLL